MAQWYYTRGGQQQGPVEEQALKDLLSSGELQLTELVWREGMSHWQPAASVQEFAGMAPPAANEPAPLPATRRPLATLRPPAANTPLPPATPHLHTATALPPATAPPASPSPTAATTRPAATGRRPVPRRRTTSSARSWRLIARLIA